MDSLCEKLIFRHPHIYGDVEANDEETVKANWEQLKLKEGNKSVLEGVPKGLPSLVKAYRMQDKVRGVGFDWDNEHQVWDKVEEELAEFKAELDVDAERATDEFGDVLFALVNFARFKDINPDEALERTNRRFRNRFQFMEKAITLHFEKFVAIFCLLNAALEFDKFTSCWFNIKCHIFHLSNSTLANSLPVIWMILVNPLLVKTDKVLCVD